MMHTLFIEKKAMELRYERACLLVYHEGKRVSSVPLLQVDRIVVAPHVALTAGVLGVVAENEVALLVINSRLPKRTALLTGTNKGDVHRRLQQYELFQNQSFRLHWARVLVQIKVFRQYRLLFGLLNHRPDLRYSLTKVTDSLRRMSKDLSEPGCVSSLVSLRGKEGAASAIYFKGLTQVFPPLLRFNKRNRRPPKDPVNVCLSLAYTLFYQEAVTAIMISGLDSTLGCLHEPCYNRDSLACDLLEPIRPLIDAWVYELFHQHILRYEDFLFTDICLLQARGKQRFYEAFRVKVPAFRRLLRKYARFSAKVVCQHERTLS